MVARQLGQLENFKGASYLCDPSFDFPEFAEETSTESAAVSRGMKFEHQTVNVNDVVFVKTSSGERVCIVKACLCADKRFLVCAQWLRLIGRLTSSASRWQVLPEVVSVELVYGIRLRLASFWKFEDKSNITVIN